MTFVPTRVGYKLFSFTFIIFEYSVGSGVGHWLSELGVALASLPDGGKEVEHHVGFRDDVCL